MGFGAFVAGAAASAIPVLSGYANYKAQEENLKYTKKMQRESWARDDSALQRRVADAEAAGLNPQLALGSGASNSGVVATTPPQHPDYAQSILNNLSMIQSVKGQKLDNKLKEEQSTINNQIQLKNIQDISEKALELDKSRYDYDWYKNKGMPTDAGNKMTEVGYMFDLFKNTSIARKLFGEGSSPSTVLSDTVDKVNDTGHAFSSILQNQLGKLTHGKVDKTTLSQIARDNAEKARFKAMKNRMELEAYKAKGRTVEGKFTRWLKKAPVEPKWN